MLPRIPSLLRTTEVAPNGVLPFPTGIGRDNKRPRLIRPRSAAVRPL